MIREFIGDFFSSLFLVIFCMIIISPFIIFSFISIRFLLSFLIYETLAINFISLLITLIFLTYIPITDNMFIKLSPIIERYVETNSSYPYKEGAVSVLLYILFKVMRFRSRLKIGIYAISFILVFIANIQECGLHLIQNLYLNDIRVVINGAVLTFVVFDRLVNEYQKLREKTEEPTP